MTASWPMGFGGGFQGGMTGIDNIRFLARIYRRDPAVTLARVEAFAELGEALEKPVRFYSSGMRARLAFGLSLAIEFDCYLIDEVTAVGDLAFIHKCERELFERRADRAFIIATHDLALVRRVCDRAIVIERGRAKMFEDVETAMAIYATLCEETEAAGREFAAE
jgi:capsular polysaccharide transport system ATP-binding protein